MIVIQPENQQDFLVQKTNILSNEKGQSAIEFVLTFAFALGVTFLFLNQSINLTSGYLVHYANFMASRTYLVYDMANASNEDQVYQQAASEAQKVFSSYPLKNFGINAKYDYVLPEQGSGLMTGTTATFEQRISSLPLVGGSGKATLHSESFLGKEPTRYGCFEMVCSAITGSRVNCAGSYLSMDITLFDNGC